MANELKRDHIKVHQTLHGYSEGHRLLEGSTKLVQADARIMLVLSDASGSGTRVPSDGYLTGYPLPESGKYVLARTWAAPEMSRPGCVWTHSLLIDFADLARLASTDDLRLRFVRPLGDTLSGFQAPIEINISRSSSSVLKPDLPRAGQWISALYGKPKNKVTAERGSQDDDGLVLAIWMQQWPRLRRAFRFCTFSIEDRSTSADVFDFQLIDSSRSSRSRMPDSVQASSKEAGEWIEPLLEDLARPETSGLRRFVRDVGADLSSGRAAMIPLSRLYVAVAPGARPELIADAISELDRLGPNQGRMGRAAAARTVLSRPNLVDRQLFEFALDQVRFDRELLGVDPVAVGNAVLRWRPNILVEVMSDEDPMHLAVEAGLSKADADYLVDVLQLVPDAGHTILSVRPDILEREKLWRTHSIDAALLIGLVDVDRERATGVVAAMIAAARDDCSSIAAERFGVGTLIRAISGSASAGSEVSWPWLHAIAHRPDDLSVCLADGTLRDRWLLIRLAYVLAPDAVPNSVGEDPWVTAVHNGTISSDDAGEDHLAAFLFNRAMGMRSKSADRLFFFSVQRLHEALAAGRLPDTARRLLDQRLSWVAPWREWDVCERLRRTVVVRFIDCDLLPVGFGTVVNDGKLWTKLVVLAADSSRGRRYLDRVRRALQDGSEEWWRDRARVISRTIK